MVYFMLKIMKVDIYESRPFIGGKVGSFVDRKGNHIEMGLHVFFGCYSNLFRLMKKVILQSTQHLCFCGKYYFLVCVLIKKLLLVFYFSDFNFIYNVIWQDADVKSILLLFIFFIFLF